MGYRNKTSLSQVFGRELVLGEVKVQVGMKRMWVKVMVMEQKRTRARKPGDRAHGIVRDGRSQGAVKCLRKCGRVILK